MRVRWVIGTMVAAVMMLASGGTAVWAESNDENPCDPANGRYICDGTENQPVGGDVAMRGDDGASLSARAGLPSTGVSDDLDDPSVAMTDDLQAILRVHLY